MCTTKWCLCVHIKLTIKVMSMFTHKTYYHIQWIICIIVTMCTTIHKHPHVTHQENFIIWLTIIVIYFRNNGVIYGGFCVNIFLFSEFILYYTILEIFKKDGSCTCVYMFTYVINCKSWLICSSSYF